MVNDPSNIPSRRRRAASQPTSAKQVNGNKGKDGNTQQTKQDSGELAQLQQLSLANSNGNQTANNRHNAKPAPLFVIEHEKVVPPLQKQLSGDEKSERVKASTQKKPATKHVSAENNPHKQNAKSDNNVERSNNAQQPKTEQAEVKASSAKTNTTRSVATSPALVSMNNEPIPYKRRRRQSTVDSINGLETQKVDNSDQAAAKYAKKAPKSVTQSSDKAATKANKPAKSIETGPAKTRSTKTRSIKNGQAVDNQIATSKASDSKMTDNKGPVPSKRRRRQPSADNA